MNDERALAAILLARLFPICRSITGEGVRQSLKALQDHVALNVHEIPSGSRCYDWVVPNEWTVRDAFIADEDGRRIVDFKQSNIHLMSYSTPVDALMTFDELAPHLNTLDARPDSVPYRTSYYEPAWGFCLSASQLRAMDRQARYRVVVDTTLAPGSLTLAEAVLPGTSPHRYVVTTYCCHPSLANDNLSGVVMTTLLLRRMAQRRAHHTWHFVVAPETIGMLAYLHMRETEMKAAAGAFVVTCVAGPGEFVRKPSFMGSAMVDRAARLALQELGFSARELPFTPRGSDERQLSSPGFRIPATTVARSVYHEYPDYHTADDNLDFINVDHLMASLEVYDLAVKAIEGNRYFKSTNPHGEPMLGARGLYPTKGGAFKQPGAVAEAATGDDIDLTLWLLFLGDGAQCYIDVAERLSLPVADVVRVATTLREQGLIVERDSPFDE